MPIDPSIALQGRPPDFMSPAQMISLRNVVRAGQLQQLQIAEATRQMQERQRLSQLYAQPGAIDPATGAPTIGTATSAYGISPEAGQQAGQARGLALRDIAQAQNIEYQGAERRAGIGKENARSAVQAFDQAMKDKPGDVQNAIRVAKEDEMSSIQEDIQNGRWHGAGFPEGFDRKVMSEPMTIEKINNMRAHFFTPQELAKGSEAPKTRKITQGLTEIDQEWDPASKTWKEVGRGPKAPGTVISMQPPPGQQAVSKFSDQEMRDMSWDDFAKLQKSPISGNALHLASMDLFLTGKMPSLGFAGRGAAGNARLAVMEGRAKIAAELGVTPEEAVTMPEKWKSNARALAHLTTDLNNFEPYVKMLHTNADIAIQLGQKIQQTTPVVVNRPLNWLRMNMGSNPDVAEYLAQMRIVQTEAARAVNNPRIVGQLTDEARREIDAVISGNAPIAVTERVLNRLKQDGTNRFTKMREQQADILGQMRGQGEQAGGGTTDKFQTGKVYKDAKGNRAKYLGNGKWEEVK